MSTPSPLVFKALTWSYDEINRPGCYQTILHVGGMTANQETVHLVIDNFTLPAVLELPSRIQWTPNLISRFKEKLYDLPLEFPIDIVDTSSKYRYLYREAVPAWIIRFPTKKSMYDFDRRLKRRWTLGYGVTMEGRELKLHEVGIDPIIKYTALYQLPLAGWLQTTLKSNQHIAQADYSAVIDYTKLKPFAHSETIDHVEIHPLYMSFDIETYSKNHDSKEPDATIPENVITQIGIVVGRLQAQIEKKYCLTLVQHETRTRQDHNLIPFNVGLVPEDSSEIRLKKILLTERTMLLYFFKMIQEHNPDVFMGYNIFKFDWPYILERSRRHNIEHILLQCGRYPDAASSTSKVKWHSSAYGDQEFEYISFHGRLHMDILVEIERSAQKFSKYSLNYVSQEILEEKKDDLTHRELFMIWQLTIDYIDKVQRGLSDLERSEMVTTLTQTLMRTRQTHGIILKYRNRIIKAATHHHDSKLLNLCTRLMGIMADYCVQDCMLPIRLCHHLNLWPTALSMSRVMCVPIAYLTTRGQQIRVVAQVLRECIPNATFIQKDGYPSYRYQGATVIEVNPGHREDVFTMDFSSLYPTLQLSYNLCQNTHLRGNDYQQLQPHEYRKFDVHEHVGCPHDPMHRRCKKDEIFCNDNTFYYRRVQYDIDENGKYTEKYMGIVPRMIQKLLAKRRVVKKEMGYHLSQVDEYKKRSEADPTNTELQTQLKFHETMAKNKNAEQLAIKVSANSTYGASGTKKGILSCVPIASIVTAMGRRHLMDAIREIQTIYPTIKLVYGDSVPGYTPVLVRHVLSHRVHVLPIRDLFHSSRTSSTMDGKEYCPTEQWEVWSDLGFTPIRKVIRHVTNKRLYRVTTTLGMITVTEDHSLLTADGRPVTPKELELNMQLMAMTWPSLWTTLPKATLSQWAYSEEDAWAYGIFYKAGFLDPTLDRWCVRHSTLPILNKWKTIMEKRIGPLHIYRDPERLVDRHVIALTTELFKRDVFLQAMTSHGSFPILPDVVMEQQQPWIVGFIQGLCDGDASHTKTSWTVSVPSFYHQPEVDVARLAWIIESMGYHCSCHYHVAGMTILAIDMTPKKEVREAKVTDVFVLPSTIDSVYDLETENHHFGAGIGSLILHNTDSAMLVAEGQTRDEAYKTAKEVSRLATHKIKCLIVGVETDHQLQLKSGAPSSKAGLRSFAIRDVTPNDAVFKDLVYEDQCRCIEYHQCLMELTFENMYDQFFLRTKKRYTAYPVDEKGHRKKKVIKGVMTNRRDSSIFTRKVYSDVDDAILNNGTYAEVLDIVQSHLSSLYGMRIHHSQFVIYKGMKRLMDYAKHIKKKDETTDKRVFQYFIDKDKQPVLDPTGPLDPRLIYSNTVQSHLGLRMIHRGVVLPPNHRLEYLYLDNPSANSSSEKAEDYGYFLEHHLDYGWTIDLNYYANTLQGSSDDKQVAEMMKIKYPGTIIYDWGAPADEVPRLLTLWATAASDLLQADQQKMFHTIQQIHHLVIQLVPERGTLISTSQPWRTITSQKCTISIPSSVSTIRVIHESRKFMAKVDLILALLKDPVHRVWLNTPWPTGCMSLGASAHLYKSMTIINAIHKKYGAPRRRWHRGPHSGVNITIPKQKPCKMITKEPTGHIPALTLVWVIQRLAIPTDEELQVTEMVSMIVRPNTKSDFTYTIIQPTDPTRTVSGVLREQLISHYHSHQHDLSNMIDYHQQWKLVRDAIVQLGRQL